MNIRKIDIKSLVLTKIISLMLVLFAVSCAEKRDIPDSSIIVKKEPTRIWVDVGLIEIINNDTIQEDGLGNLNIYPRTLLMEHLTHLLRCVPRSQGKFFIVIDQMRIEKPKEGRYEVHCDLTLHIEKNEAKRSMKIHSNSFREFTGEHNIKEVRDELIQAINEVITDSQGKIIGLIEDFII